MGNSMPHDHTHLTDEQLVAGLDAELPPRQQEMFTTALETCTVCRSRAGALARATQAVTGDDLGSPAGDAQPSAAWVRTRLLAAMRDEEAVLRRPTAPFRSGGRRPALVWASAAVLVLAAVAVSALAIRGRAVPDDDERAVRAALPVAALTPGAWASVSLAELCGIEPGVPPIPDPVRREVLTNYRMEHVSPQEYELDYLVTPDLGGIPDPKNLWPQRYMVEPWNALVKDELERLLSRMVCTGRLDLRAAQVDMATDWVAAYRKYFRTQEPLRTHVDVRPGRLNGSTAPHIRLISSAAR